jgi:hypothetical protein
MEWIEAVAEIDVEFIPKQITDYTNDKTAFDAMIIVKTKSGGKGLISIETKYTDLLGSNTASDSDTKNKLVKDGKFFTDALMSSLQTDGYKQIHRNWLLTYAYAIKNGFDEFVNVVISPVEDTLSGVEIAELKKEMTKHKDSILKISLQDFVNRGLACRNDNICEVMKMFEERYLRY